MQGAALKKILIFKECRGSSFSPKAMLEGKAADSDNITLKWLFRDKRNQFVLWGTCFCDSKSLLQLRGEMIAHLWQQWHHWVCSNPALLMKWTVVGRICRRIPGHREEGETQILTPCVSAEGLCSPWDGLHHSQHVPVLLPPK